MISHPPSDFWTPPLRPFPPNAENPLPRTSCNIALRVESAFGTKTSASLSTYQCHAHTPGHISKTPPPKAFARRLAKLLPPSAVFSKVLGRRDSCSGGPIPIPNGDHVWCDFGQSHGIFVKSPCVWACGRRSKRNDSCSGGPTPAERRSCLVWPGGGVQCLNHLVLVKEAQTTQDRENFSRCGLMEVNRQKRTIGCLFS